MESFYNKYKKYQGFTNFLSIISDLEINSQLKYLPEKMYGGKIGRINNVLNKFSKYNIKVDQLETEDSNIRIEFYTIDDKLICFAVLINTYEQIATIENFRFWSNCFDSTVSSKDFTNKLMKIAIEICKQSKIKTIYLTDRAYYSCKSYYSCDSKHTLNLKYANTLTSGQPYYYKYGFKFVNEDDHLKVKLNRKKLDKIKTSDIKINKLVKLIKSYENKFEITSGLLNDIVKLYNENLELNVKVFFSLIKYKYCVLFSLIYFKVYENLGLKMFDKDYMYLHI